MSFFSRGMITIDYLNYLLTVIRISISIIFVKYNLTTSGLNKGRHLRPQEALSP